MRSSIYSAAIVIVVIAAFGIMHMVDKTASPRRLLLTSATNQWRSPDFSLPTATHFNLVLGLPSGYPLSSEELNGFISVRRQSKEVLKIPFDAASATPANWLNEQKLEAYILTWPLNRNAIKLDHLIEPNISYTLIINFTNNPPKVGSLWMTYLQKWKHRNEKPNSSLK